MPYNSFYPYNYTNPYSFYQPNFPVYQPTMMQNPQSVNAMQNQQPTQAVQPLQTQQSSIIWVSNEKEAAMYPIAPNNAVTLWDQSEPVVYLKQADPSGKPTMKTYDLVEREEAPKTEQSESASAVPNYATKDELAAVVGVVKSVDELIGNLKNDIETMKGDMYGIAGKKKTASRKHVQTEDEEQEED